MKKTVIVSVLALALVALAEQKASAWTNFKVGLGFNIAYTRIPSTISIPNPALYPPGPNPAYGCYYPGYANPGAQQQWQAPAPLPGPANSPAGKPTAQSPYGYPWGPDYQLVGYQYPVIGTAPSYWYGK